MSKNHYHHIGFQRFLY